LTIIVNGDTISILMNTKDYYTPNQATEAGYAPSAASVTAQIRLGKLKAIEIVPNRYLIHKDDLEDLKKRREYWKKHRHNKNKGRKLKKI
jgi:hypothetical protein